MRSIGLYIHVPFCVRKCNYCDFYSLACPSEHNISDYVSIICTHIEREAHIYRDCIVDSIFLGGGTPSLIGYEDMLRLCNTIRDNFNVSEDLEFSIEANPGTLTPEKLRAYRECGINRISIGLQSSSDNELKALGRIHTRSEFEKSYSLVREAGFDNVSVDIMYALPRQGVTELLKTVDYVAGLNPSHISAYCLKIEDGTPFSKMELTLPDEDTQYEMYVRMCERLLELGYEQYEISNFAKNGARCAHNLKYWRQMEYVGFGPSAHSFFDGARYFYEDDIASYKASILQGNLPKRHIEDSPALTSEQKMDEYVMLALRLVDGVNALQFKDLFGVNFEDAYDIKEYIDSEYIIKDNNSYHFSYKGFFVSNFILSNILKNI